MTRDHGAREDTDARAERSAGAPPGAALAVRGRTAPGSRDAMLALQRAAGNAAVTRLLARQAAAPPVSPAVQAVQTEATQTATRLQSTHQALLASSDVLERNTGELFSGASPRMAYAPMTKRSDSEQIRLALGRPAGQTFYFTGTTQPAWGGGTAPPPAGTLQFGPTTMGTIQRATGTTPDTILVRGKFSNGTWQSVADMKQTFIHEASHILVASYGQHPGTSTSASSFDRYRDEFRSYWISEYSHLAPNERWQRIRTHLVGTSATSGGYANLRARYWATTPTGAWANPAFRAQVDAHRAPDGFNLRNSIRLDRLFAILDPATASAQMDDVIHTILRLRASERAEAARSSLITQRVTAIGGADADRIRRALSLPTHAEFTGELNPDRSPRLSRFLVACALNRDADIIAAYRALQGLERGALTRNAAVMVFVDHHVSDLKQRAAIYAMMTSARVAQFDAMVDFLDRCLSTNIESILTPMTGPPADLVAALGRLTLDSRLSLYRLVEDARRLYVDDLPDAVKRPVLRALRGDRVEGIPEPPD